MTSRDVKASVAHAFGSALYWLKVLASILDPQPSKELMLSVLASMLGVSALILVYLTAVMTMFDSNRVMDIDFLNTSVHEFAGLAPCGSPWAEGSAFLYGAVRFPYKFFADCDITGREYEIGDVTTSAREFIRVGNHTSKDIGVWQASFLGPYLGRAFFRFAADAFFFSVVSLTWTTILIVGVYFTAPGSLNLRFSSLLVVCNFWLVGMGATRAAFSTNFAVFTRHGVGGYVAFMNALALSLHYFTMCLCVAASALLACNAWTYYRKHAHHVNAPVVETKIGPAESV
jgi:hypothetical protein